MPSEESPESEVETYPSTNWSGTSDLTRSRWHEEVASIISKRLLVRVSRLMGFKTAHIRITHFTVLCPFQSFPHNRFLPSLKYEHVWHGFQWGLSSWSKGEGISINPGYQLVSRELGAIASPRYADQPDFLPPLIRAKLSRIGKETNDWWELETTADFEPTAAEINKILTEDVKLIFDSVRTTQEAVAFYEEHRDWKGTNWADKLIASWRTGEPFVRD